MLSLVAVLHSTTMAFASDWQDCQTACCCSHDEHDSDHASPGCDADEMRTEMRSGAATHPVEIQHTTLAKAPVFEADLLGQPACDCSRTGTMCGCGSSTPSTHSPALQSQSSEAPQLSHAFLRALPRPQLVKAIRPLKEPDRASPVKTIVLLL